MDDYSKFVGDLNAQIQALTERARRLFAELTAQLPARSSDGNKPRVSTAELKKWIEKQLALGASGHAKIWKAAQAEFGNSRDEVREAYTSVAKPRRGRPRKK